MDRLLLSLPTKGDSLPKKESRVDGRSMKSRDYRDQELSGEKFFKYPGACTRQRHTHEIAQSFIAML